MALTVKDILQLKGLRSMKLIAGEKGLDRYVASLGTADYEFASFADEKDKEVFKPDMIVLTSLLFAKDDPELILSTVKYLYEIDAAALACKSTVFHTLPQQVIDFANEKNFPIIQYGADLYMESIIFEVLDALRAEDDNFFSEENIEKIIEDKLSKSQVFSLSKNISLKFKDYVMAVYLKSEEDAFRLNLERYTNVFYLNRSLNNKGLLCKYKNGLFAVLTARQNSSKTFEIILDELLEFLAPPKENLYISCSRVHEPYQALDQCIRESYYTHIASVTEAKAFYHYERIGTYQFLVPLAGMNPMKNYMESVMEPILKNRDFLDTVEQLTFHEGDIFKTAAALKCHHNTIRYRISKIKHALLCDEMSEQEFFVNISLAVKLYMLSEHA